MPSGTGFNPRNVNDFDKSNLNKNAIGLFQTVDKNTTTNIDYTFTDDMILAGGSILLVKDSVWGDSISLQVLSGATLLIQFLTNWPIDPQKYVQILPSSNYPAKIITGLTIRAVYSSTGNLIDPQVAVGFNFEKILL